MTARGSRTVVALANNLAGVFQQSVLQGAQQILAEEGMKVEAVEVGGVSDPAELRLLMQGIADRAAGLLVISSAVGDGELQLATSKGAVATLVSHYPRGLGLPTMMFDNNQGIRQLMQHVVNDCGRSRLVYVGGDAQQLDGQEREKAFLDEAVRHGLRVPPENLLTADFTPHRAGEALARFVAAGGQFDCVIAADYLMALAAQSTLRVVGLRVPEDVTVVGFGDGPEAEAGGVTTVAADVVQLGMRAARQLVAQLGGRRLTGRTLLSTHLVRRASSC